MSSDFHPRRRLPIDMVSRRSPRPTIPRLQDSQVILILGEPSTADLHALLTSYYFDLSLLVIATHSPLEIPHEVLRGQGPDIRVLCMPKPLALDESSGSVRLISLLERACRVVKAWRDLQCSPSPRHLVQDASDRKRIVRLSELTPGGEFTLVEPLVHEEHKFSRQPTNGRRSYSCFTTSLSTSPLPSQAQYAYTRSKTRPHPNHHRRSQSELNPPLFNFASSSLFSTMTLIEERQPFNAILNFFPVGLPEKVLLKQTVLVTALCSPYLSVEARSNDVTGEPTSSFAFEGDPTSNYSGGRAPNHGRSASSKIAMDNRRHRFSALSFLSSISQGSANSSSSGRKPTWTRRLSLLLGNAPAAGKTPAPRSEVKRRRPNAHLVHILPEHWVPAETAKIESPNTPLARHRTLTVPSTTISSSRQSGGAPLKDRRRYSMPVSIPAASPSCAFVHARAQGSLLRRATLLHAHAMSTKKQFPVLHSGRELASSFPSRDSKPKLAQHMGQFLSDYFAGSEQKRTSESVVVVPYVIASGCLGNEIPGAKRFPDVALDSTDGESHSRKITVGELVLLGALDFAHNCWIGSVDDVAIYESQEKMETRAETEGSQGPQKRVQPEIIKEPRFPPPIAVPFHISVSSTSSSSSGAAHSSSRSNEKRRAGTSPSLDVMLFTSPASILDVHQAW